MKTERTAPGGEPGTNRTTTKCNLVIHQSGLKVNPENIPEVLKDRAAWVCWRLENRDGKPTKVPKNPRTGSNAKSNDPTTWSTFADAVAAAPSFDGVGIMFAADLCGVDLDDCRDPETGELEPWAAEVVADLDSYAEASPSGTGVHILLFSPELPGPRRRKGRLEMYGPGSPRFFTVTGDHLPGTPATCNMRPEALGSFYAQHLADPVPAPQGGSAASPVALDLSEADLLQVAFHAANGAKIRALFEERGRDGGSEGDAALCALLAFYSGGDAGLLERLMRASQRARPKWQSLRGGETWIARECRKAVERQGDYYTPSKARIVATGGETPAPDPVAAKLLALNCTDAGNGEVLAFLYGDRLRFNWTRERWLRWGGHLWVPATDGDLTTLAKEAARKRYVEASRADNTETRKWAFGSESRSRVEAALHFARAEAPITDPGDGWDSDPLLLGCENGVVELGTGTFRPGRPEDKVTMKVGVAYDPEAECPRWLQFLGEVFEDDDDLLNFVWRSVGYSLTGSTKEQVFFLLHGKGSNGKTLFLNTLRHVLGDYAHSTTFSLFDYAARQDHSQNLAQLDSRRFVTASESAENCRLNEDRLKALAGSEPITARLMRENDRTFTNTVKLWLGVNHRPRVLDDSEGFWRKARLVPFSHRFALLEELEARPELHDDPHVSLADRNLTATLKAEAPGILRWAVQGAALWAVDGLHSPDCVRAASQAWREEADPLGDFFATRCVFGDACKVRAGDLFASYCQWAEEEGLKDRERMTQQAFGRRIAARFDKKQRAFVNGKTGPAYYGIGLRAEGSD